MAIKLRTTEKLTIVFATLAVLFSLLGALHQARRGASPLLGALAAAFSAIVAIATVMAARARERTRDRTART